ncbi:MAG: DsbC family protein, partial [Pseudomonadota bacterium]
TTEVNGLYEVVVGPMGSKIYYATADGRYLVTGDIIDLNTRISLTQSRAQELEMAYNDDRLKVLDTLGDDNMIAFGPDDAQDTVTVITDVNCGYCRKLHREMDQYNTEGIRVRYVLTDLFGGKDSRQKAEAVWCAEDRKDALTKVKNREAIEMLTCEAPLDQQIAVGTEFGVTGTPAIVLPDGQLIRGYKPAKDLKALLDMKRLAQESLASEMNGKPTEQPGSVQ